MSQSSSANKKWLLTLKSLVQSLASPYSTRCGQSDTGTVLSLTLSVRPFHPLISQHPVNFDPIPTGHHNDTHQVLRNLPLANQDKEIKYKYSIFK